MSSPDNSVEQAITKATLSDIQILREMDAGNIVIVPFNIANLQSSSYDLRLGRYYYAEQDPGIGFTFFNPYREDHVNRVWGEAQEAQRARILKDKMPYVPSEAWDGIEPEDEVILMGPGETFLCHTEEFIGYRNIGTTMMKARSSMGRLFISVCKDAGWGDNGYINRWTMEVTNFSRRFTIPLVVGTRVAQLIFFHTGETDRPYHVTGSYQNTDDLSQLEEEWKQRSMLPQLKKS